MFKNGISVILQKFVRIFEQLLLVPFYISAWGSVYYGEWLSVSIVIAVFNFVDFGLGNAASNTFVLSFLNDKKEESGRVVKTATYMLWGVLIVGILLIFLALAILNYFGVFNNLAIAKNDLYLALPISMLTVLFGFFFQFYQGFYLVKKEAHVHNGILAIRSFATIVITAILLYFKFGLVVICFGQLIVQIVFLIFHYFKAKAKLLIVDGLFDKEMFKDLISKGGGYLLSPMWQVVLFQGTTLLVRFYLGPHAVTIFNTTRTLSRTVGQVYNIIENTIFPDLQYSYGKKDFVRMQNILGSSLIVAILIGFIGCTILLFLGPIIYKYWTKSELNLDFSFWSIMVLGVFINAIWWTASTAFRAVNKPYYFVKVALISSLVSLGLSLLLIKEYSLIGVAMGLLFFECCVAFFVVPKCCEYIETSVVKLLKSGLSLVSKKVLSMF